MNVQKMTAWLPVTQETIDDAEYVFCVMFDLDPLIHSAKYVEARSGRIWLRKLEGMQGTPIR